MRIEAVLLMSTALLGGCATAPGTGRGNEEQRLARQCQQRGGVLVPSGANTGRAQLDFVCQRSGASRIPGG